MATAPTPPATAMAAHLHVTDDSRTLGRRSYFADIDWDRCGLRRAAHGHAAGKENASQQ